jgi:hypothetical protein
MRQERVRSVRWYHMPMNVLYAVIDDVYDHTVGAVLAYLGITLYKENPESSVIHLPSRTESPPPIHTEGVHETSLAEPLPHEVGPPTMRAISTVMAERVADVSLSHSVGYIASAETPLFGAPTKDFDTVIMKLGYGTMVMILEEKGRFSRIAQNGMTGWVLRDDLVDRAAHVYPDFREGGENHADDPNTLRTRACIKDVFHGGEAEVVLQSGEYVLYRLIRKGLTINWPPTRPRVPGRWHTILRGTPGIYIGIAPKTGGIMEYTLENDVGHLVYVEAVFPDERITISEVNNPDNGIYHERTLTKEEWQLLNPVFIQVL